MGSPAERVRRRSPAANAIFACFLLPPIAIAGLAIAVPGIMAPAVADDAFFFIRYARNFLEVGRFAWNTDEAASFANTSQLYQFLIASVQAAVGYNPVRILAIASQVPFALCVLTVLAASVRMIREEPSLPPLRAAAILLLAGTAIGFSPKFAQAAWSGMDTTLAALAAALYVALADGIEQRGRRAQFAILALSGWAMILARPELGLLAVATPLALGLAHRRVEPWILPGLAGLGGLLLLSLCLAWLSYGDPLPLPFYVKSLGLTGYGDAAFARYRFGNLEELYLLFRDHAVLVLLVAASGAAAFRHRPVWWGLIGGSLAVAAYQALVNAVPITGGGARFFLPVYPILVLAMVRAALAAASGPSLIGPLLIACVLVQAALLVPPYGRTLWERLRQAPEAWAIREDARATMLLNREGQREKWPALERMEELPEGCAIATTEMGLIGALYPRLRLVDLSGLVDPRLKDGLDPRWLIEEARPDILFPGTAEFYWSVRLDKEPGYRAAYADLRVFERMAPWPIAIRADSPCGQAYATILAEEERRLAR
ncbi:MAG TPA: hypothetical protein VED46_14920 [Alphaproteobacteria bacterium]|nr:hypothetical protein [Alphaproteobacteria bacterium]